MGACLTRRRRRAPPRDMANTLHGMKMTNSLRNIVSKQKKRYTADGFNLDLSYITENLIAMGFPAEKLEACYRNRIDDVARMLDGKHKGHYKIYNLCSERAYDRTKFQGQVAVYPFKDHNPPKIELIQRFCEDVHAWLNADSRNVAAVHCKAGKGRTGTMICCYMLYSGQFRTAADALNYYSKERTHDLKGVTIPSQRRYVEYYASLLNMGLAKELGPSPARGIQLYNPPVLQITELTMEPPPTLNGGQGTLEFFVIESDKSSQKVSLGTHETRRGSSTIHVRLDQCIPLVGDINVAVYNNKPKLIVGKEKLFHFWFNTFFVKQGVNSVRERLTENGGLIYKLEFDKWHLDEAHKDTQNKLYSSEFKVQLVMECIPENSSFANTTAVGSVQPAAPPSPSSSGPDSDESSEHEEGWDSAVGGTAGGAGALLGHYQLLSESELDNIPNNTSNAHTTASQPEVERMLHA